MPYLGTNPNAASGYSGYSGYSGNSTSGFSGISGYSGISGFSGISGSAAASGFSGYSGTSGYSGVSGYSGISGFSGDSTSGFSGDSGISGYSGISGFSGASGISGYSGYSGISGFSGYSGYSGVSGYSGISGFSGQSGVAGAETITYTNTFTAGNVIKKTSGGYALAQANTVANAEAIGVVQSATGANFTVVYVGAITGLSGLIDGDVYFLSDTVPGSAAIVEPTTLGSVSKPILVATGTTTGIVLNMRGILNGSQTNTFVTSVPATSASPGEEGYWAVDSTHFYVYDNSTSKWRRTVISGF